MLGQTLLGEGLLEPEFYGDLVYKCNKFIGRNDFLYSSENSLHVTDCYATVCMLIFNPIMVDNYAAFFNCMHVGRSSESMMAPT